MFKDSRAFTLIELSIVLVIIGLIVGGVLVGRDLIKSAELRSVITDIENFKTATNTFLIKYDCIPGDCPNATTIFGTDSLGCPAGGGTGTCDGNGDRLLSGVTEGFRFWQQLGLANMIAGKYTGVQPPNGTVFFLAVPQSRIPNSGYQIITETQAASGWTTADASMIKNTIRIGAVADVVSSPPARIGYPIFTGKDAYSIDLKIDDGKPGSGSLWAHGMSGVSCISATDATATYNLTSNGLWCLMQFTLNIR